MNELNLQDTNVAQIREIYNADYFVLWILGNQCTYSCSYCPEHFHSGSIKYQPTELIQKVLNELPKSHVMFTGGEATYHPDFEKIVLEKPDHISISVISNASRPIVFWERIAPHLKSVTLTFHAEFAKLDRFLETCVLIYNQNNKPGRINLTMIPEKWDECINAFDVLTSAGIRVTAKPLVENFGFQADKVLSTYTKEQLQWISNSNKGISFKNIAVTDKDDVVLYKTNPSELISTKQTNFNGWQCFTNTQTLYIDGDGTVFDTACKQRNNKGNIYSTYDLNSSPMICEQNFCWCHADILPKKVRLNVNI